MAKTLRKGCLMAVIAVLATQLMSAAPVLKPIDPGDGCAQTIDQPGQYVLTGDLACSGAVNGIVINSSRVVLHLAGHTISNATCDGTEDVVGIFVTGSAASGVQIEGGTITGFNDGVILSSSNSRVSAMRVSGACFFGILGQGDNNRIERNAVTGTGYGVGLVPSTNTVVASNDLSGNAVGVAISDNNADNNFVQDNVINDNNLGGGGTGVLLSNGSGNTIRRNAISYNQSGVQIDAPGNSVTENTVSGSSIVGISTSSDGTGSTIKSNKVLGSGQFDLSDANAACDSNVWRKNVYATDSVATVNDNGPATGCIRY